MEKKELIKKARKLGIPVSPNWKIETIEKKIFEKESKLTEEKKESSSPLEQAMTLLLQSQAKTTELLTEISNKLDIKKPQNKKEIKTKIIYVNEWLVQPIDKRNVDGQGKNEYKILGNKQFKDHKKALEYAKNNGGLDKYRILPIPTPISVEE